MMSEGTQDKVIDRYAIVAGVLAKVASGMSLGSAIAQVTSAPFPTLSGRQIQPSTRTLYRWIAAFKSKGMAGLVDPPRQAKTISRALPKPFLDFLSAEKEDDPDASLPEIIRRAELRGIIAEQSVDRSTVWRTARRLNLPIFAEKHPKTDNMRRFAHPYRMRMMLSDGKYFRVGPTRRRRVALAFLDDCSRYGATVVVGKSESTAVFLRGLHKVICRVGLMDALFLDGGPGFISSDTMTVCARLNIALIHGRARYPEGHGKIERFNQTYWNDVIRGLAADQTIDTTPSALEHRLEHYLTVMYNRRPHESLDGLSPEQKWAADGRPLRLVGDMRKLEQHFLMTDRRKVANDNVIMVEGVGYETPRGHAGRIVQTFRHLLDDTVAILHEGKLVQLAPVDLAANARDRRAKAERAARPPPTRQIKTAADLAFERDHKTMVTRGGDFFDKE
jgi:transposase InsO family protein